jgi:hypothetical protein
MQACLDGDRAGLGTQVTTGTTPLLDTNPAADLATLKFRDDSPPTLKFRDDVPPTLKFRDDIPPTPKFRDDTPPTLKFRDDVPPTLKFRDDTPPTLKFRDDAPPTLKFRDDVKQPILDKPPITDTVTGPGGDFPFPGPGPISNPEARGGVPYVLSTPHHSMAWTQSFPQAAQAELQSLAQHLGDIHSLLTQYAEADAQGQLTDSDRAEGDLLNQEYDALLAEYQRHAGG